MPEAGKRTGQKPATRNALRGLQRALVFSFAWTVEPSRREQLRIYWQIMAGISKNLL
jgi:hypothetical protein